MIILKIILLLVLMPPNTLIVFKHVFSFHSSLISTVSLAPQSNSYNILLLFYNWGFRKLKREV